MTGFLRHRMYESKFIAAIFLLLVELLELNVYKNKSKYFISAYHFLINDNAPTIILIDENINLADCEIRRVKKFEHSKFPVICRPHYR